MKTRRAVLPVLAGGVAGCLAGLNDLRAVYDRAAAYANALPDLVLPVSVHHAFHVAAALRDGLGPWPAWIPWSAAILAALAGAALLRSLPDGIPRSSRLVLPLAGLAAAGSAAALVASWAAHVPADLVVAARFSKLSAADPFLAWLLLYGGSGAAAALAWVWLAHGNLRPVVLALKAAALALLMLFSVGRFGAGRFNPYRWQDLIAERLNSRNMEPGPVTTDLAAMVISERGALPLAIQVGHPWTSFVHRWVARRFRYALEKGEPLYAARECLEVFLQTGEIGAGEFAWRALSLAGPTEQAANMARRWLAPEWRSSERLVCGQNAAKAISALMAAGPAGNDPGRVVRRGDLLVAHSVTFQSLPVRSTLGFTIASPPLSATTLLLPRDLSLLTTGPAALLPGLYSLVVIQDKRILTGPTQVSLSGMNLPVLVRRRGGLLAARSPRLVVHQTRLPYPPRDPLIGADQYLALREPRLAWLVARSANFSYASVRLANIRAAARVTHRDGMMLAEAYPSYAP